MITKEKVLVVGQGLTGSVLALQLLDYGHDVWIVDEERKFTSSKVAAGLFNPVIVGRLKLTWNAEELFSHFANYYSTLEQKLKMSFYHPLSLVHLCYDIEEQNNWDVLTGTDIASKWVEPFSGTLPSYIHSKYGSYSIKSAGWLDLSLFLKRVKDYFISNEKYISALVKFSEDVKVNDNNFEFQAHRFDRVFLCRGEFERMQVEFPDLPYNPVKGQLFDIKTSFDLEQKIFHKQVFLLPIGKRTARVGSTYTWDEMDYEPTNKETDFLKERLDDFLKGDYEIEEIKAGVRPAFHYGRPIFAEHEQLKKLYVLNGMGSKGVTLAPYFAENLLTSIYEDNDFKPIL